MVEFLLRLIETASWNPYFMVVLVYCLAAVGVVVYGIGIIGYRLAVRLWTGSWPRPRETAQQKRIRETDAAGWDWGTTPVWEGGVRCPRCGAWCFDSRPQKECRCCGKLWQQTDAEL